jgi:hypothetical protein
LEENSFHFNSGALGVLALFRPGCISSLSQFLVSS